MAATYGLKFDFKISALRLQVKTKYNDNLRADRGDVLDLSGKIAVALNSDDGVTTATGANLGYGEIISIPAGGTANIDLRNLIDLAGRTTQALARYKFLLLMLLPTAKGGTACSGVTVGNALTTGHQLYMGADAHTTVLENGDWIMHGKGTAAGKVVDGSNKDVLITNNDGLVAASFLAAFIGALS